MGKPVQDFLIILRTAVRLIKWLMWGSVILIALIFAGELYNYFQLFSAIHPVLGWAFLVAVAVLAWWLVGVPIMRFLSMPVAIKPPPLPTREEGLNQRHLAEHLGFIAKYLRSLRINPLLQTQGEDISAALQECEALRGRMESLNLDDAVREVQTFEGKRVEAILKPLDAEAERVIRNEAIGVGVATAVSLNGTLDALIVLWRNVNMISRIARIYYGRPGPRGSITILRDVSTTVLLANYLDNVTDYAGGLLGKWMGGVASAVAGPVLNGGANAVMTLRMGYLAKARCRSFQAWTEDYRRSVLIRCLRTAKDASMGVLSELVTQLGGVFGGVMGGAAAGAAFAGSTLLKGAKETMRGAKETFRTAKDLFSGQMFRKEGEETE